MKLRSLELDNFKKFDRPVRIVGIADGLNLLYGPNEMGKSTILAAMKGVFFEKHRSRAQAVVDFQTAGNKTSPVVRVEFELDNGIHSISKKFLGRDPHARLVLADGRRIDGDEAEEELQRLLGFSEPHQRGANAESLGMWGILWVQQGESFAAPALAGSARSAVQAALEAEVGVLTGGGRGQALPAAIEAALFEIVGKRGDAKGRYAAVVGEIARIDGQLPDLTERQRRLSQDIEDLGRAQKELVRLESDAGEEEDRRQLHEARRRRDEVVRLQARIKGAAAEETLAKTALAGADAELKKRDALARQAREAAVNAKTLVDAVREAHDAETAAGDEVAKLRKTVANLEAEASATGRASRELRKRLEVVMMEETLSAVKERLAKAEAAQARITELTREAGEMPVTEAGVKELRGAKNRLDAALAALNAVATELAFAIEPKAAGKVNFNGAPLPAPDLQAKIVDEAVIEIAGIGRIAVRPAVKDRRSLLDAKTKAEQGFADLLDKYRVADVDAAETQFDRKRGIASRIDLAKKEIGVHAPAGIDALRTQVTSQSAALDATLQALGLKAAPPRAETEASLAEADRVSEALDGRFENARAALVGPEAAWESQKATVIAKRAEQTQAAVTATRLENELKAAEAAASRETLAATVEAAKTAVESAEAALVEIRKEDTGETEETVVARIERLSKKIEQRRTHIQDLKGETGKLRTSIQVQEGDGIEERIRRLTRDKEQLERERAMFEREAKVLNLLKGTLAEAEREARERYMAPIVKRIRPYLNALFPGSTIAVNEEFRITGVVRDGAAGEEFGRLSAGTREQIAVLVRLAFAEMLIDQGKPAAVILDDALVFADDARMERFFDILTVAAKKMQIIVLSCRKQLFEGLAANRLKIERTEEAAAAAE